MFQIGKNIVIIFLINEFMILSLVVKCEVNMINYKNGRKIKSLIGSIANQNQFYGDKIAPYESPKTEMRNPDRNEKLANLDQSARNKLNYIIEKVNERLTECLQIGCDIENSRKLLQVLENIRTEHNGARNVQEKNKLNQKVLMKLLRDFIIARY